LQHHNDLLGDPPSRLHAPARRRRDLHRGRPEPSNGHRAPQRGDVDHVLGELYVTCAAPLLTPRLPPGTTPRTPWPRRCALGPGDPEPRARSAPHPAPEENPSSPHGTAGAPARPRARSRHSPPGAVPPGAGPRDTGRGSSRCPPSRRGRRDRTARGRRPPVPGPRPPPPSPVPG